MFSLQDDKYSLYSNKLVPVVLNLCISLCVAITQRSDFPGKNPLANDVCRYQNDLKNNWMVIEARATIANMAE